MTDDIRWIQRLQNWNKALAQLSIFMEQTTLNELEKQGLIQSFEYNHELAWKTQKDFLTFQGHIDLYGSRNVAIKAFEIGLITNGDIWVDMIDNRNLSSHTYNEETTKKIIDAIVNEYYHEFIWLNDKLNQLSQEQ